MNTVQVMVMIANLLRNCCIGLCINPMMVTTVSHYSNQYQDLIQTHHNMSLDYQRTRSILATP